MKSNMSVSARNLIIFGLLLFNAFILKAQNQEKQGSPRSNRQVVVIGAGVAGLTAGRFSLNILV